MSSWRHTTNKHVIQLTGPAARGARISATTLRELVDILIDTTRGALRLRVEGRSSARGTSPNWLNDAAAFDVTGIEEGSTQLVLEAPPLAEIAPALFAQQSLLRAVCADDSALDVAARSWQAAVTGGEEDDAYDQGLLKTIQRARGLFQAGILEMRWIADTAGVVTVGDDAISRIDQLIESTPQPQRTMVAGTLNMIRHSDRMFALILEGGESLRGVADASLAPALAELWGQSVLVSGTAVFRSAGGVLRIEADSVEPVKGDVSVWSRPPGPLSTVMDAVSLHVSQGPRSGINAVYGRWPGDESDAEFLNALQELS